MVTGCIAVYKSSGQIASLKLIKNYKFTQNYDILNNSIISSHWTNYSDAKKRPYSQTWKSPLMTVDQIDDNYPDALAYSPMSACVSCSASMPSLISSRTSQSPWTILKSLLPDTGVLFPDNVLFRSLACLLINGKKKFKPVDTNDQNNKLAGKWRASLSHSHNCLGFQSLSLLLCSHRYLLAGPLF